MLAGVESTDGYTGTLADDRRRARSALPSATFARKVEVTDGALRVERQTEAGYDVVTRALPALVTVTGSGAEPRYPTLKGIMGAKSKPLEQLTLADLGLSAGDVAPTQRVSRRSSAAPQKGPGEVVQAGDDAPRKLADLLAEAKVI